MQSPRFSDRISKIYSWNCKFTVFAKVIENQTFEMDFYLQSIFESIGRVSRILYFYQVIDVLNQNKILYIYLNGMYVGVDAAF